ncbi:MAG: right-handed parallel beta-helix repeat-containing protein, partial [Planctomycetota bacterium]
GGSESGDGGFVEVSGKQHVEIYGLVDASAAGGKAGTFLIDPTDVTISDTTVNMDDGPAWNPVAPDEDTGSVAAATIIGSLQNGTPVSIDTSDDGSGGSTGRIIVNSAIDVDLTTKGGGSAELPTLTLNAQDDIEINAQIGVTATDAVGDLLNLILNAATGVDIGASINTDGGDFTSIGTTFDNTGGIISTDGGAIAINHTGAVTLGADLDPGGGPMSGTSSFITVGPPVNGTQIQDAIDIVAGAPDGTYTEDLTVNKDLTLKSENGRDNTTIQLVDGVGIDIGSGASGFTLGGGATDGFTIDADDAATTFNIQLTSGPSDVEVFWNTIDTSGNASMGVSIGAAGAAGLTISNNNFTADSGDGAIWGPLVSGATISGNTFTAGGGTPGYAIQFSGLTTSTISENQITDYGQGISIFHGEGVSDVTIERNVLTGCTNGIRFGEYKASGGPNGYITNVTVQNNTIKCHSSASER